MKNETPTFTKGRKIIVTRIQQVEVPVSDDYTISDFCEHLSECSLFDDDRLDWNKEDVIEEDYSFAAQNSQYTNEDYIYEFNTPYGIGTLYENIEPRHFVKHKNK